MLNNILKTWLLFFLSISVLAAERPNIVWIVTEDNSAHWLRLYEPDGAAMPHIERLAKSGLTFSHAFSNAPVCSVARSTIISGCYAPRVGAQYHRRAEFAPMPDGLNMFPYYLQQAGYYTTNNSKEDYNFKKEPNPWNESSNRASYRNREPGQPFFHVQNFGTTHEGRLHFSREEMESTPTATDPETVKIFPYHPDTRAFRYTYAREYDHHRRVDAQIGEFLKQLEADGLMDDTIVFYYGDHGGVLPRSKGYVYESGLQVPMVVYYPEKWRDLFPAEPGSRIDGFVSFVDLAPSVLNLAGVEIPEAMDGTPFLGEGVTLRELNARNTAFGYADRFDEKYDLVRTLRRGKFKYMRSYQPFNHDALYNEYRYKMLAYREWLELYKAGELNAAQSQFFQPRHVEGLYDLENDPHEIVNLARNPAYADLLVELRRELRQRLKSMPDLSFFPEPYFLENGIGNPVQFGRRQKETISRLIDVADLSLRSFDAVKGDLERALGSTEKWERYWGLIVCGCFGEQAAGFSEAARKIALSEEENPLVRTRAAEFLGLIGGLDPRPLVLSAARQAADATELNLILNTAAMFEMSSPAYDFRIPEGTVAESMLQYGNRQTLTGQRVMYLNEH